MDYKNQILILVGFLGMFKNILMNSFLLNVWKLKKHFLSVSVGDGIGILEMSVMIKMVERLNKEYRERAENICVLQTS